ncbi:putative iron/ascorbate-dependent oxidoreductase [Hordeum vulgare]|nr:putative iron/ascorbate-dependent oxidoreductase [Hordeum vulgare]
MVHQAQGLLVQEVAADGELPSRYVLKEQQGRPAAAADAQHAAPSVPTVDMGRLADVDAGEADKLRSALASWGLFAVTGHGMTDPFLDAILGAARGFFHLPTEAKQEYSNVVGADDGGRKFQPEGYGVDRVDKDEQVLDWCDRLYLQVRPDDARQLRFWPTHPSDLAELLKEFSVEGEKSSPPRPRSGGAPLAALLRCAAPRAGDLLGPRHAGLPHRLQRPLHPHPHQIQPCPRPAPSATASSSAGPAAPSPYCALLRVALFGPDTHDRLASSAATSSSSSPVGSPVGGNIFLRVGSRLPAERG